MLDRRARRRAALLLSWIVVVAVTVLGSRPAHAYPWMIRHEYQGCVPCHSDPSGAGLLTEYGRAMGENVLRSRYGSPPADEPPAYTRFLFGVPTPDWLLLGGSVRNAVWWQSTVPAGANNWQFLQMEADLRAEIKVRRFRASGSLGWMRENSYSSGPTQITSHTNPPNCTLAGPGPVCGGNLVSRQHWLGVALGADDEVLLRAGHIDLPFGIRDDNHEMLVRSTQTTRTNLNESQQDGIAVSYVGAKVRGEIMAILGNYQMGPDSVRARGYAGFAEFSLAPWAAVGLSSMVTYARWDYLNPLLSHPVRQVHGVFARLAPKGPLVILSEVDALVVTSDSGPTGGGTSPGGIVMVEADVEVVQGVHLMGTLEGLVQSNALVLFGVQTAKAYDAWATAQWFFLPHCDVRLDFVASSFAGQSAYFFLPQLHIYL